MKQEKLLEFQKKTGYEFKNVELLITALTHSSYSNENRLKKYMCNERLEFLGDAVLELVSSEQIYKDNPTKPEGDMTRMRASWVCEPTLALCARDIDLGEYVMLGRGEDLTGGRERDSILSDTLEATIGAVYLDGGFEKAKEYIDRHILKDIEISTLELDHSSECLGYSLYFKRTPKFNIEKAIKNNVPKLLWQKLQSGKNIVFENIEYSPDMVLGDNRKGIKISFIADTRPIL